MIKKAIQTGYSATKVRLEHREEWAEVKGSKGAKTTGVVISNSIVMVTNFCAVV